MNYTRDHIGLPHKTTPPGYTEAIPYDPAAESFDPLGALHVVGPALRRYKLLVFSVVVATLAMVATYIIVWPSTYQAEVGLIASAEQDAERNNFYSTWAVFRRNQINDEIVLFGSGPVLKEVVEDLGLTYDDVYHPPRRYAVYLWSESALGKAWRDFKDWVYPSEPSPFALSEEEIEVGRAVKNFRDGVSVQQVGNSNVGLLVVRASTPRVHEMANAVAETYLRQRRETFKDEAMQAYTSLKAEVEKAHEELTSVEREMEQYFTENDMLLMFEKDKIGIGYFETLQAMLAQANRDLAAMKTELETIGVLLSTVSQEVLSARQVQQSPVYAAYEQQIAQLMVNRQILSERYQQNSPEIRDVDNQLAALRQQMAETTADRTAVSSVVRSTEYETLAARQKELQVKIAAKETEVAQLADEIVEKQVEINKIPQKMKISHDLGRTHQALERKYLLLQERLMTASVSAATAASAPATLRIIEWAVPPEKAIAPNKKMLVIAGTILGLLAGTALAVLLDIRVGVLTNGRLSRRRGFATIYAAVRSNASVAPYILTRG